MRGLRGISELLDLRHTGAARNLPKDSLEGAARLAKAGIAPYWGSAEDVAALIRRNAERLAGRVTAAGLQPE